MLFLKNVSPSIFSYVSTYDLPCISFQFITNTQFLGKKQIKKRSNHLNSSSGHCRALGKGFCPAGEGEIPNFPNEPDFSFFFRLPQHGDLSSESHNPWPTRTCLA